MLLQTPGIIISSDTHYTQDLLSTGLLNIAVCDTYFTYRTGSNDITWNYAASDGTPLSISVYTEDTVLYTTLPGS